MDETFVERACESAMGQYVRNEEKVTAIMNSMLEKAVFIVNNSNHKGLRAEYRKKIENLAAAIKLIEGD